MLNSAWIKQKMSVKSLFKEPSTMKITGIQSSAKLATSTQINAQRRNKMGARTSLSLGHKRRMASTITRQMRLQAKSITVLETKAGWKIGFLKTI